MGSTHCCLFLIREDFFIDMACVRRDRPQTEELLWPLRRLVENGMEDKIRGYYYYRAKTRMAEVGS